MSGSDGFLARWARRKQAAKGVESASPSWGEAESKRSSEPGEGADADTGGSPPHPPGSRRVGLSPEGRGEKPSSESEEPLPAVEDLHAESDITAFLREGVPDAVRKAALRRVWAVDPAIRDFVSPAEYAWDFNDPNSIPGFSSSVGRMDLSGFFSGQAEPAQNVGEVRPDQGLPGALPALEPGPAPSTPSAGEGPAEEAGSVRGSPAAEGLSAPQQTGSSPDAYPTGTREQGVSVAQSGEPSDILPRRHGGALPR